MKGALGFLGVTTAGIATIFDTVCWGYTLDYVYFYGLVYYDFKDFIKGSQAIENHFGYFPSFHDDYIESIEITSKTIVICIRMESSAVNLKQNANERLKLTFGNVKKFSFEGELYGCVSIILDMVFEKKEEGIITKIETSLGTEGVIHSEDVSIELLP